MSILIVAASPVRLRALSQQGQDWLDRHSNPIADDWEAGWLLLSAIEAGYLASLASRDGVEVVISLR
jgi:hypothetical protein